MDNEQKLKIFDEIHSIINEYYNRIVEQGFFDPDDMDKDCFFDDIMSLVLDKEKWQKIDDLPYVD